MKAIRATGKPINKIWFSPTGLESMARVIELDLGEVPTWFIDDKKLYGVPYEVNSMNEEFKVE